MSVRSAAVLSALCITTVAGVASARSVAKHGPMNQAISGMEMANSGLDLSINGQPLGTVTAPAPTHQAASLAGSAIATHKGDVLVIDADSGQLIRTDREGQKLGTLKIGRGAAQLVIDTKKDLAYVTDRDADRVVAVSLRDGGLTQRDAFATKAEPFGLALTPDRSQLLVTTVADTNLTAYDVSSGLESWSLELGPEPRGVAISPAGDEALVTFLTTGVVGRVDIRKGRDAKISFVSLDPAAPNEHGDGLGGVRAPGAVKLADEGRTFARNAFAATYMGDDMAIVPHQLSTPHLAGAEFGDERSSGGYGGGSSFQAPISHVLAFLSVPDSGDSVSTVMGHTNLHQPRAVAYDGRNDTLFVAAFGSDEVLAVAGATQASVHASWKFSLAAAGGGACGPTGLAVDADDGSVVAFCSLTRKTIRVAEENGRPEAAQPSGELAKSHLSASAQLGREVFRRGNSPKISSAGAMSCSNCHAEGRADSLTWFLQGNVLQTPLLVGRVMGSHPFKWDGKDHDIKASLNNTVQRLGGQGLTKAEVAGLTAFLASTEAPRTPTVENASAVARGKAMFDSDSTGCADCHYGSLMTDRKRHPIAPDLPAVDTPSLIGLATSAPYYHDGSATTLSALLKGKGNIHGMGRTSKLNKQQIGDLVAYLETL